jgi:hypothetical protein
MRNLLCCMVLVSAIAFGSEGLNGKWSGSFDITTSDGEAHPDTAYLVLKENGGVVEGTAGPNANKQWNIQNGKLDGSKLRFEVTADDGLLKFDLVFDGKTIKGTANGQRPDGVKMTAKLDLKRVE